LPDAFHTENDLKHEGALSKFIFMFVLQYAIRVTQENTMSLERKVTRQFLATADDILLGRTMNAIKKHNRTLLNLLKKLVKKRNQ
jgi:hypothetical protein